ncbi:mitochondrial distribution and morphology proteins-domain-containing protein [Paraphoma chrysanthemicola]|uniref:Mitochondrial distribution and morphology proteins-domain-containing protein n=1 Tax=Paraphoma chrysanthemicola TaxID=798071 RepID=A0A8K0VTY8_9PLEO|nr:mitochondrial distribution and morphology proteins-domain-containing protein [Paraphoma chrysanthemicola]
MSRNVGWTVGAILRRAVVDQPLTHNGPLPRFTITAWSKSLSSNGAQFRSFASRTHAFGLSSIPSPPNAAPCSAPLLRQPLARTSHTQRSVTVAVLAAWSRNASSRSKKAAKKNGSGDRRNKSSVTDSSSKNKRTAPPQAPQATLSPQPQGPPKPAKQPANARPDPSQASSKHLLDRIPHSLPHLYRPTKAELLEAASGFWSRIKIHFKWLTIRSARPFNADEIYALFSWILAAHVLWIVLGTTTFFMLTVFLINTAFSQETLAKWIGNYLTKSSGIKVVFETAVVPKWKDGVISFRKVYVSRRPGQKGGKVSKGSQTELAAAIAAKAQQEKDEQDGKESIAPGVEQEEDTNYTQFDISIDTVNVTLSFSKWFNGKGLLEDVEIKGIRGVIDRTSVHTIEGVDPRSYKHEHNPGDFELNSFKMEDLLVTVYQPDGFRPFAVSVYSCDLPQLRKQWLFYDFLSANMMSGSFDNSLFTIHPRQTHNYTGTQLSHGRESDDGSTWKKHSRIRIDALNIDHLNRGYDGPFSWIHEGNVDIIADIMLPNDDDESLAKVMSDMYDRVEATVTQNGRKHHFSDHAPHGLDEHHEDGTDQQEDTEEDKRFMIMDMRVHLNDVRAAVPIFTRDISYVNNALVRPIVAYINSKRTFIPVNCRVVKRVNDFDGSWTLYDSGLMEEVSREMYDAFARDVLDDRTVRKRRIKKVGIWTLQLAAQALFLGLAGNMA